MSENTDQNAENPRENDPDELTWLEANTRGELTLDMWYQMNHHDWNDLVNEHNMLLAEVERLRYIVDSIPDEVWEDMRTWESMQGVIE